MIQESLPGGSGACEMSAEPESLIVAFDRPEVKPTWSADRYRCCSNPQIHHTYTSEQWKLVH